MRLGSAFARSAGVLPCQPVCETGPVGCPCRAWGVMASRQPWWCGAGHIICAPSKGAATTAQPLQRAARPPPKADFPPCCPLPHLDQRSTPSRAPSEQRAARAALRRGCLAAARSTPSPAHALPGCRGALLWARPGLAAAQPPPRRPPPAASLLNPTNTTPNRTNRTNRSDEMCFHWIYYTPAQDNMGWAELVLLESENYALSNGLLAAAFVARASWGCMGPPRTRMSQQSSAAPAQRWSPPSPGARATPPPPSRPRPPTACTPLCPRSFCSNVGNATMAACSPDVSPAMFLGYLYQLRQAAQVNKLFNVYVSQMATAFVGRPAACC